MSFVKFKPVRDFMRVSREGLKKHYSASERAAFDAHGWYCHYCGIIGNLTSDHIVPQVNGGTDDPSNIVPACRGCNSAKGKKSYEDYLEIVSAEKAAYLTFLEGSHI